MDPQSVAPEEGGGTLNDGTIVDDHQRLALLQVEEENRLKEKVASAFDERRKKTGLKIVDFEESATWKQSLLSRHPESSRQLLGRADLGGG